MASRRQVLGLAAGALAAAVARAGDAGAGAGAMPAGVMAASPAAPLAIGETFTMASKILGETRRINVYSARAWNVKPDAPLPVLFMLDGGVAEDFVHTAGLLQISVASLVTRSFMLVGIENTQRRRDLTAQTRRSPPWSEARLHSAASSAKS